MVTVLVTGGVRSGKSRHAEQLLQAHHDVAYVAAGPVYDDADWAARIAAHQARRPASWHTLETADVAEALRSAPGAVLVDCLGTWLTAIIDAAELWEAPVAEVEAHVFGRLDEVMAALAARAGYAGAGSAGAGPAGDAGPVILVTNEVGLGVVPEHRSARLFRDLLGTINQRVGEVCDEVHLVVAGRVLTL